MPASTETFAGWLRARVDAMKAPSDREAARRIGIEHSALSEYIAGKRQPGRRTLLRLAEFFGVELDFLFRLIEADERTALGHQPIIPSREKESQSSLAGFLQPGIQDSDPLAALADPRFRLAFYELNAAWPDLTTEEQEDLLATIAHRQDTLRRRREQGAADAGGDPAGGRS